MREGSYGDYFYGDDVYVYPEEPYGPHGVYSGVGYGMIGGFSSYDSYGSYGSGGGPPISSRHHKCVPRGALLMIRRLRPD